MKKKILTMEKLFVQIFERKKWILEQVKHQIDLYDHQLASKCIIDGIAPPPWLWPSSTIPSESSLPNELSKEELISGLLLQHPRPAVPNSTTGSPYKQPVSAADNLELRDLLYMGFHPLNRGLANEDELPVPCQNKFNDAECASTACCEQEPSVTSPQDCNDAIVPDKYCDPALSLSRIQRSRSRQKALESKSRSNRKSNVDSSARQIPGSKIASVPSGQVYELEQFKVVDGKNEGCEAEKAICVLPSNTRDGDVYSGTRVRSTGEKIISAQEPSNLGNSSHIAVGCGNFRESIGKSTKKHCQINESLGFVEPLIISNRSCKMKREIVRDSLSKEECNNYFGRITRSRSSSQQHNWENVCLNLDSSFTDGKEEINSAHKPSNEGESSCFVTEHVGDSRESIGKSTQKHDQIIESLVMVEPLIISNKSCEMKSANVRDSLSKEKEDNNYSARITRSRSSSQQYNCVKECMDLNRSLTDGKPDVSESLQHPSHSDGKAGGEGWINQYAVNEYASLNTRSWNSCSLEVTVKPVPSSSTSSSGAAPCRFNVSDVVSIAESQKSFKGVNILKLSGTQFKPLPLTNDSETIGSEICDMIIPETDTDCDGQVKAASISYASRLDDLQIRMRNDGFASSQYHDLAAFANPKQLDLSEVEDYNTNETCSLALENKVLGRSLEENLKSLYSAKKLEGSISTDDQEKFKSTKEIPVLEECHVLTDKGKPCTNLSEACVELPYGVSRNLESNVVSSVEEMSEDLRHVIALSGQENNKISEPNLFKVHSSQLEVTCKNSPENPLKEALNSDACADKERKFSFYENFDVAKPTHSVPETSNRGNIACSGCKMSPGTHFAMVGPVHFENLTVTLEDHISKHPSNASIEVMEDDSVWQKMDSDLSQGQLGNSHFTGRCITDNRNSIFSKSTNKHNAKNSIQPLTVSSSYMHGSWPQNKRRKLDSQKSIMLSTSPAFRDDVIETNAGENLVRDISQHGGQHMVEQSVSSPKLQLEEREVSLKEKERKAATPALVQEELGALSVSSLTKHSSRNSQNILLEETEEADPTKFILDDKQVSIEGKQVILHHEDQPKNTEHLTSTEATTMTNIIHPGENRKALYHSGDSLSSQSMAWIGLDQSLPMFEGFIMETDKEQPCIAREEVSIDNLALPKTTIERASMLEQMCRSACICTPLSDLATTSTLHKRPNLHHSVPNGLLECTDLRSSLLIDDTGTQLEGSSGSLSLEVNHPFYGMSHYDCLPFTSSEFLWDIRKPCTPPSRKLWDRNTSKSGSSEKRGSLNSELPCITEENENADEAADTLPEDFCLEPMIGSTNRKPLSYIEENLNQPASIYEAEIPIERPSLDSINMELSCNKIKPKLRNQNRSKRRNTNKGKENNRSILLGASGAHKAIESLNNKLSKPKLSSKTSLRKQGLSLSERESKCNNIVSNITSFVPLVQQKKAPAVTTGKRDVKVKALETAEAAKRLAEKKEKERKMKKEALKLERERQEQEKLKQLEMQKKKDEEIRKKKEGEMAERKRQREEEEIKEKERKRKRLEEAQKQQREYKEKKQQQERKEKLCVDTEEKELKYKERDGKTCGRKESKDDERKLEKIEQETKDDNLSEMAEMGTKTTGVSTSDAGKINTVIEHSEDLSYWGDSSKVSINSGKAMESCISHTVEEQSYEISPYKGSDDEDDDEDEEDDIQNIKPVPSWASKNCLALAVSSQDGMDPEKIFPPDSFCNVTAVLVPRTHQLR